MILRDITYMIEKHQAKKEDESRGEKANCYCSLDILYMCVYI